MVTRDEWLAQLKAGDQVVITRNNEHFPCKIDRTTPTQVVIGSRRFRRKNGDEIGGDRWWCPYLQQLTPEIEETARRRGLTQKLRFAINHSQDLKSIPLERLEQAVELLTTA